MNITIGIATRGRPAILGEVLAEIDRQTRPPQAVIICHVS
ncbi:MAG: glycosyltransferase family 2 protein, partial [Alphaproteobacteria bacterium]|nr:glycosyltransferase family 2 protein [Alphaproteobacteria bacterium]